MSGDGSEGEGVEGLEVPLSSLAPATLRALVEEFVTRDGTDNGDLERDLEQKVADVLRQLERGEARIVFDPITESANIVPLR